MSSVSPGSPVVDKPLDSLTTIIRRLSYAKGILKRFQKFNPGYTLQYWVYTYADARIAPVLVPLGEVSPLKTVFYALRINPDGYYMEDFMYDYADKFCKTKEELGALLLSHVMEGGTYRATPYFK